jgi:hypothetical protein
LSANGQVGEAMLIVRGMHLHIHSWSLKHDGIAIIAITITVLMALASSSGSRQDDRFQISSLSSSYRYANLSVLQEQIKDIIIIRTRHSAGICTYVRVKSSELYLDA